MKAQSKIARSNTPESGVGFTSSRFGSSASSRMSATMPRVQTHSDFSEKNSGSSQTSGAFTNGNPARFAHNLASISIHPKAATADSGRDSSQAGTKPLDSYLPLSGPLADLAGTRVKPVHNLATRHRALAQASDGGIEIDSSIYGASSQEMRSVLAHEAIHIAQQRGNGNPASRNLLEAEATHLSHSVLAGKPVWPVLSGSYGVPLQQPTTKPAEPTEKELREIDEAWKKAMGPKQTKLDHLKAQLRYLQKLKALIKDRQGIEMQRMVMDRNFVNIVQSGIEGALVSAVNWKALNISVMPPMEEFPGELDFNVRFQARFLGRKKADVQGDFTKLRSSLEKGVQQVWGQTMSQMPALVRNYHFNFTATVSLVDETDARDTNFWLIEVDPNTTRAHTHPDLKSGYMSVSPADVNKPDTLGHESLHLFGLTDRYQDNATTHHSESIRGTGPVGGQGEAGKGSGVTRNDPLDTGSGAILPEDLEFVFSQTTTYEQVIMADMTPYDLALMKQFGWGRVPRLSTLVNAAQATAGAAAAAQPATANQKQGSLSDREKTDPQKIVVQEINDLIMQVNMDIDNFTLREHMLDLPDMAPPAKK